MKFERNKKKSFFLTAFSTAIKKEPTMSVREHANELKVHQKTARITIKKNIIKPRL